MSQSDRATAWQTLINATRRRINLAWWLEILAPICIGASVLVASLLLFLRSRPWFAEHSTTVWISAAALVILLPIIAWVIARRHFVGRREATVRLEDRLKLNNALTAAESDIAAWPEPPVNTRRNDGFTWNWPRLTLPPILATLIMVAAFFVPVEPTEAVAQKGPRAWDEMDEWFDKLEEEQVVKEEALDEMQERLDRLRSNPDQEWFGPESMEATDTMRASVQHQIDELGRNFQDAERSLSDLEKHSSSMSQSAREQRMSEFQKAVQGLEMSGLPNQELMDQLGQIDPSNLQNLTEQMSQQQLQDLREQLQKNANACQNCTGNGSGMGQMNNDASELQKLINGESQPGMGQGQGQQGPDGNGKPGRGGLTRGRGDAPMSYGDEQNLNTDNIEGISNADIRRAAPGDLIGIGQGELELDEVEIPPSQGGAVQSTGEGGQAVWQEDLLPDEQEVLRRYFK